MQVELAQLEYLKSRLSRLWLHLSRLAGGIGTKGPGETQLESDKRQIETKIKIIKTKLKKIKQNKLIFLVGLLFYEKIFVIARSFNQTFMGALLYNFPII